MNKTTSTSTMTIKAVLLILGTTLIGSLALSFLILGVMHVFG